MYSPYPESLNVQDAEKLSLFFGSDERKLLERLIRSEAGRVFAESGDLLAKESRDFLSTGNVGSKVAALLANHARFCIALEVIEEMKKLITVENNEPHVVVSERINILG